jgi:hypothetical protein
MASANNTSLEDIIVPSVFSDYVTVRTAVRSALVQSGIASANPVLAALASGGGDYVTLPYWNDLTGASEVLPDGDTGGAALTPGKIAAESQQAVKMWRGRAWSANDMAAMVAGDDPMRSMADGVAAYWTRDEQTRLVQVLTALFTSGGCLASTHVLDVSAGGRKMDGEAVIEAAQLLGDAKDSLTAIAMHSAKHSGLQAQNLIEYVTDPETGLIYSTYLGKRVVVDDGCPYSGGVYTSYLFAAGAIARVPVPVKVPAETDRDSLAGDDILISRQGLVLHVAGTSYVSGTAGRNPSNATLATASSWAKVWDDKQIRVVALRTA